MSNAESSASSQSSAPAVVGPERLPREVVELLTLALRRGATDVLLAVDRPPSFRVSSTLTPVEELTPPGSEAIVRLAHTLLGEGDRKSTRLNSSHGYISYAVFCLKKKKHHSGFIVSLTHLIHVCSSDSQHRC